MKTKPNLWSAVVLSKDIKVGNFVNYNLVFHGKYIKYLSKVLTNHNGKSNIECYCEKTKTVKRFCVRIAQIHPLNDYSLSLLKTLDWNSLPQEPIQKICLKSCLFDQLNLSV